jgi:hypothetical protein
VGEMYASTQPYVEFGKHVVEFSIPVEASEDWVVTIS